MLPKAREDEASKELTLVDVAEGTTVDLPSQTKFPTNLDFVGDGLLILWCRRHFLLQKREGQRLKLPQVRNVLVVYTKDGMKSQNAGITLN